MERMLTAMVNRASPAARRMLGRVKLDGQKNRDTKLNHTIRMITEARDPYTVEYRAEKLIIA